MYIYIYIYTHNIYIYIYLFIFSTEAMWFEVQCSWVSKSFYW